MYCSFSRSLLGEHSPVLQRAALAQRRVPLVAAFELVAERHVEVVLACLEVAHLERARLRARAALFQPLELSAQPAVRVARGVLVVQVRRARGPAVARILRS